jgi:hypothetical protein
LILLLASIAALGLGPLAYRLAGRQHNLLAVLDGFVFVAIGGLVVLSVLPESMAQGGWPTLGFVLIGFAGPTVAEHLFVCWGSASTPSSTVPPSGQPWAPS